MDLALENWRLIELTRVRSSDFGRVWRGPFKEGGFGWIASVPTFASCGGFCLGRGRSKNGCWRRLECVSSLKPSMDKVRGFGFGVGFTLGFGFAGGGPSCVGSWGKGIARCGFGDRIGGGDRLTTVRGSVEGGGEGGGATRFCSNMRTSDAVGGTGVSSRRSFGVGIGLFRAAASRAAMFDGEETRSATLSSGTPRVLVLGLLESDLAVLLLPVWSREMGADRGWIGALCWPVPTLDAASSAPWSPPETPVYRFAWGFGLGLGFAKAEAAPINAASRTLNCVSPVGCGTRVRMFVAELIESPSVAGR